MGYSCSIFFPANGVSKREVNMLSLGYNPGIWINDVLREVEYQVWERKFDTMWDGLLVDMSSITWLALGWHTYWLTDRPIPIPISIDIQLIFHQHLNDCRLIYWLLNKVWLIDRSSLSRYLATSWPCIGQECPPTLPPVNNPSQLENLKGKSCSFVAFWHFVLCSCSLSDTNA